VAVGEVDAVYGGGGSTGADRVTGTGEGVGWKGWGGNLSGVDEDMVDVRIY
jgi:hypothetical protein